MSALTHEAGPEGAAPFDPFEPGFAAWPYDQYARLRAQGPVVWSELLCGWMVTSFEEVVGLLRDHRVSSDLELATSSTVVDLLRARHRARAHDGMTLVLLDDPEHARLRKALQAPFTARRIGLLRRSIETRVDHAVAALAGRDELELVADLAYPLPVGVFCEMLGIPAEHGPRFGEWTAAVARSLDLVISEEDYDRCMERVSEMEAYLADAAAAKRREPGDDVLTELVHAEVDGAPLREEELAAQLVTLYVAGHEPTTALIGNGMVALLDHPDQLARLQARPDLIPAAVHELLRYDGPNQFLRRIVQEPLRIGEHDIAPGEVLYLAIGAANHDPARWGEDADQLDVERVDAAQHAQFGGGIHHCLGAHLARAQAEVALTAVLTRLGGLESAGDARWSGRMTLRSVTEVPLRLHRP